MEILPKDQLLAVGKTLGELSTKLKGTAETIADLGAKIDALGNVVSAQPPVPVIVAPPVPVVVAPPVPVVVAPPVPVVVAPVVGDRVPSSDLPGWKLIYTEDFNYPTNWGGFPWHHIDFPQNFQYEAGWIGGTAELTGNSSINLKAVRGERDSQGICSWMQLKNHTALHQTYGKYLVRMRASVMQNFAIAPLLWPVSERWPVDGEIDFAEDYTGQRKIGAFSHYELNGEHQQTWHIDDAPNVSGADWHVWGCEWTETEVRYTLDGRVWATDTGAAVPHTPMWLGFVGANHQLMPVGRGDWEIDWIAVFKRV